METAGITVKYRFREAERTVAVNPGAESVGDGVSLRLDLEEFPLFKAGQTAKRLVLRVLPNEEIVLTEVRAEIALHFGPEDRIFVNGFQSWTESREFDLSERIPPLRWPARPILKRYGDYEFYRYTGRRGLFHGWTYSYVRRKGRVITLFGSLSEAEGYTLFEFDVPRDLLRVGRDCSGVSVSEEYKALDFVTITAPEEEAFDFYFGLMFRFRTWTTGQEKAAAFHEPGRSRCSVPGTSVAKVGKRAGEESQDPVPDLPVHRRPGVPSCLTGWTSWYKYYTKVTVDSVLKDLHAFEERGIPIQLFQIDDGWEPAIGDWLEPCALRFPVNMGELAAKIRSAGYVPGLWLAPFICERKSRVWNEHPEWVLRDEGGHPVKAGFNPGWSGWFFALDVYEESFRDYLRRVFRRVLEDWGFEFVKLDFLYAAGIQPRKTKTRGRVMCDAMAFLREIAGARLILGCGVPLGPAFGLVEYCRIGSDVALRWEDHLLKLMGYRERVSTANSIASTVGRHHLNGRAFYNDPDVIILRPGRNRLTPSQRLTLFRLNASLGGIVLTSDAPSEYSEQETAAFMSLFEEDRGRVAGANVRGGIAYVALDGTKKRMLLANLTGEERSTVLQQDRFPELDAAFLASFEPEEGSALRIGPYESIYLDEVGSGHEDGRGLPSARSGLATGEWGREPAR